jgi:hypothetical protein
MSGWTHVSFLSRSGVNNATGTLQVLCKGTLQVWYEMRAAAYHSRRGRYEPQALLAAAAVCTSTASSRRIWTAAAWTSFDAGTGTEAQRRHVRGLGALPVCVQEWLRHATIRLHVCVAQVRFTAAERSTRIWILASSEGPECLGCPAAKLLRQ